MRVSERPWNGLSLIIQIEIYLTALYCESYVLSADNYSAETPLLVVSQST